MARAKSTKRGASRRKSTAQRTTTGRIRIRRQVSERRATLASTPEVREVRERIAAAIADGQDVRRGILERMERMADLPASAIGRRVRGRGRR